MFKCALIIYGAFVRSIGVSLFIMTLVMGVSPLEGSATPNQLWEDYVFAERPREWVEQRPEGSPDRIFFEVLNAQSMGQLERAARLLDGVKDRSNLKWVLSQLRARQTLLEITRSPSPKDWESLQKLIQYSPPSPAYIPPRQAKDQDSTFLSSQDDRLTTNELREALVEREAEENILTQSGLHHMLSRDRSDRNDESVSKQRRLNWMKSLKTPPIENTVALLMRLASRHWTELGWLDQLSDQQIEQLLNIPDLSFQTRKRLIKLQLNLITKAHKTTQPLVDLKPAKWKHYLESLNSLIPHLGDKVNIFRAHLALAELAYAEQRGRWPLDTLLGYLALPQDQSALERAYRERLGEGLTMPPRQSPYSLEWVTESDIEQLAEQTGLKLNEPPRALIARHIEHHLKNRNDIEKFSSHVDRALLEKMWAKSHLTSGGSPKADGLEAYLKSDDFQSLLRLKVLKFSPYTLKRYRRDQSVKLPIWVKGYDQLQVRVYTLNMSALHDRYTQIPLNLDLSGMRANAYREVALSGNSLLFQQRILTLPELSAAGSYVIDIQAGEAKTRAIIHKGTLTPYLVDSASGLSLLVIDELGRHVTDAQISLQKRIYTADKRGRYRLPYSINQHEHLIKIIQGDLCVKRSITLPKERYVLSLDVATPLLRGGANNEARVRARLTVNGELLPLSLLRETSLSLKVAGRDGTPQRKVIDQPKFDVAGELTVPITLPLGFQSLSFQLTGKLKPTSGEEMLKLSSDVTSANYNSDLNSINVGDIHLLRGGDEAKLRVVGRNGEPIKGASLAISLTHKHLFTPLIFQKRSDQHGEVLLPEDLSMISSIETIVSFEHSDRARRHRWSLIKDRATHPEQITLSEGKSQTLAWSGSPYAYLINRADQRILSDRLTIVGGVAMLKPLKAGDYLLVDPDHATHTPIIVFGNGDTLHDGLWSTRAGVTEHTPPSSLLIDSSKVKGDQLEVTLKGLTSHTRLHMVATPYALKTPLSDSFRSHIRPQRATITTELPISEYGSGGVISEELRYILKRQKQGTRIGVFAPSPSLLINRDDRGSATSIDRGLFGGIGLSGNGYGGGGRGRGAMSGSGRVHSNMRLELDGMKALLIDDSVRSWDFLNREALIKWALDLSGVELIEGGTHVLKLPIDQLKGLGQLSLVLTDGLSSHSRSITLPDSVSAEVLATRSLRALPINEGPKVTVIQRTQRMVKRNEVLTLSSMNSLWQSYHTLESVYQLYARLMPNAKMGRLRELLSWPELSENERWALYERIGGHEADLFIYHKDPKFFTTYIAPLIAQKGTLSFLDRWMIGAPIDHYLSPSHFESLNLFERILLLKGAKDEASRDKADRYTKALLSHSPVSKSTLRMLFKAALAPDLNSPKRKLGKRSKRSKPQFEKLKQKSLRKSKSSMPAAAPSSLLMSDDQEAEEEINEIKKERTQAPQFFKKEGATHMWSERRYHDRHIPDPDMISVNRFWLDFAQHNPSTGPFISAHFPEAATQFSAGWIALALLDLPFNAESPTLETQGGELKLTSSSDGVYFYEGTGLDIRPEKQRVTIQREHCTLKLGALAPDKCDLQVLRSGMPLLTQVMVFNPSSTPVSFELNHPLPEGAIALLGANSGPVKTSVDIELRPRGVSVVEYYYYFPVVGDFKQAPSYAIQDDQLIAVSESTTFKVVRELSELNTESWQEVARLGDDQDVFAYLERHHPLEVDLSLVYNRLSRRSFYERLIASLSAQQFFVEEVWGYAIHHRDTERVAEAISLSSKLKTYLSPYFELASDTPMLAYDEYDSLNTQHLDFDPLTVARAHARGKVEYITHPKMREAYLNRLKYLAHKPRTRWRQYDLLTVCYYLIKQGRIDDAERIFSRVATPSKAQKSPHLNLFYDYLDAYLKLSRGEVEEALTLANSHTEVKHPAWRKRFRGLITPPQLSEIEIESEQTTINSDSLGRSLNFMLNADTLTINSLNLKSVEVNLYPMNLEILFSAQPSSLEGDLAQKPLVKASFSETISLSPTSETTYQIPAEWRNQAVMVEVQSQGHRQLRSYSPQHFTSQLFPQRGLLRVLSSQPDSKPLAGAYVKIYAELKNGEVRFYKDGYTDFRGLLDYVNANPAPDLSLIKRFSLLIMVKGRGASTRSVKPPAH